MTPDERLTLIRVKVERANKHIRDLDAALKVFKIAHPYSGETKTDPQSRYGVYQVGDVLDPLSIPALRDEILPITGDAIHNLRSALDHLAWHLSDVTGFVDINGTRLTEREIRNIGFPIIDTDDPSKYEAERTRKVKSMRQNAVKLIDEFEPYQGGKGNDLWVLHKLDITDKHRLLVAVVADLHHIEFRVRHEGKPTNFGYGLYVFSPDMDAPLKPALKTGDVLFAKEGKANEDVHLAIEIAFSEPGIIESQPILPTLVQMANRVDSIILSFRDELA